MKTIEVTEKEVKAAFDVAKSYEAKNILAALFCNKPNLDDYKSIKSYEDACEVLGIEPIFNNSNLYMDNEAGDYEQTENIPKHIIALMQLETISRALWGKNWKPVPDAEGRKIFWYPWFALFTKDEINSNKEDFKKFGALLAANAHGGTSAGFGYLRTNARSSDSSATLGFRLCQENEDKARYFGTQFIELWAEYLAYNFAVGGRIEL